jgi:hypothetical protein
MDPIFEKFKQVFFVSVFLYNFQVRRVEWWKKEMGAEGDGCNAMRWQIR